MPVFPNRSAVSRALTFALLAILLLSYTAQAQEVVPNEWIIKFNNTAIAKERRKNPLLRNRKSSELKSKLATGLGIKRQRQLNSRGLELVTANSRHGVMDAASWDLVDAGAIEFIEPNYLYHASVLSNDPGLSTQWGLHNFGQSSGIADVDIDAPDAWDTTTGSSSVVVGVIDTGVDYTHTDLAANMWINPGEVAGNSRDDDGNGVIDDVYGYNAITKSGNPIDDHYHGTHCAGIIGAVGNNSTGVTGVAWTAKIMALKFLDADGSGTTADAIDAINYAINMKQRGVNLRVLSNSWGGGGYSQALKDVFDEAAANGITMVVAAGNEATNNDSTPSYPASFTTDNMISVASVNRRGILSSFSNYGTSSVEIGAPGEDILSLYPGNQYASLSGTSMATPMVSGVAALILSKVPWLVPSEVYESIVTTGVPLASLSGKVTYGSMVNAQAALTHAQSYGSSSSGTDTDGDGVIDTTEVADGTNSTDPGSYKNHLSSPVYTFWNSYLGMKNILELVNPSTSAFNATVYIYASSGNLLYQKTVAVPASGQYDLILNDIDAFPTDQYGLVRIDHSGTLEGRLFFYQTADSGSTYNFAFGLPFTAPVRGATAVSFNTYQPSTNISELNQVVSNWLSIINLAPTAKVFDVNTYDESGNLLQSRAIEVSAFGRLDIDGGHQLVGPAKYGLHTITPVDSSSPYFAQLIRYGASASAGVYDFAFPLIAHAGNGEDMSLPISRQFEEENYVELINTTSTTVNVGLQFLGLSGESKNTQTITLSPHAQLHLRATSYLNSGELGTLLITPDRSNSIIAQSMNYFRNSYGSIVSMYGIQSRESLGQTLNGSYNLYLGMENWLRVTNTSGSSVSATVSVNNQQGTGGSKTLTFAPYETKSLALHSDTTLNARPNSYGLVQIVGGADHIHVSEMLRRRVVSGSSDFAAPTSVR